MGTVYLYIVYTCDWGQCESVQLFNGRHDVRLSGLIQQPWTTELLPYRYESRCADCARRKREDLRIISTDAPEPCPTERSAVQDSMPNRT